MPTDDHRRGAIRRVAGGFPERMGRGDVAMPTGLNANGVTTVLKARSHCHHHALARSRTGNGSTVGMRHIQATHTPNHIAIGRVVGIEHLRSGHHDFEFAAVPMENGRGVGVFAFFAGRIGAVLLPQVLAGLGIHRHHVRVSSLMHAHDEEPVAIEHRRRSVAVVGLQRAEFFHKIPLPHDVTVGAHAGQIASPEKHPHVPTVGHSGGGGHVVQLVRMQLAARDLGVPNQRPGLAIEGQQMHALVGSLGRQVNAFTHDDRRGRTTSRQRDFPGEVLLLRPRQRGCLFGADPQAIDPTPTGPIRSRDCERAAQRRQDHGLQRAKGIHGISAKTIDGIGCFPETIPKPVQSTARLLLLPKGPTQASLRPLGQCGADDLQH